MNTSHQVFEMTHYIVIKHMKDAIGWSFTGADRMLVEPPDATKAQKALGYAIVDIKDPDEAVARATKFKSLEEADALARRKGNYIIEVDEEGAPVAIFKRKWRPRGTTDTATTLAKGETPKPIPVSDLWSSEPVTGWPVALRRELNRYGEDS